MGPRRRQARDAEQPDEAEEVREGVEQQQDAAPLSQSQGEDLLENAEQDYRQIQQLDRYQPQQADNQDIAQDPQARRRAQRELDNRDRMQQGTQQVVDEYLDEGLSEQIRQRERRNVIYYEQEDENADDARYLDPQQVRGKLSEWINEDRTIKYIRTRFVKFLTNFKSPEGYNIYMTKLREMCISNHQSISISYSHLKESEPTLAMWVGLQPALILPVLNEIAYVKACGNFESYRTMHAEVFVKIRDLPIMDYIRDLRYVHLGKLIKVRGVVTIRSEVFSQLKKIIYRCGNCGFQKGPFFVNNSTPTKLGACASCQSTGPFPIDKMKTVYRNYQKITVQESPGEVLPGRIPRSKQVILFGDNIDVAKPGDQIEITGIYINRYECYLNIRQGFPLFATVIQANCVNKAHQADSKFDQAKQEEILKFSKKKDLARLIYNSIAPSIYGHDSVKRALTLAMFGGRQKIIEQTHKIRGDINILMLGDPGIAKSQFLKSVQKIFHRSVYTTGKGASAVGLTASVKRDHSTNEWKLEAGALVVADRGICLIDQFDKMNEHDRTSIHEAMQQQSISISKAGIVATLKARCSVIAAANPIQGRYDSMLSFNDNVDLSDPILSRFDILCVMKDEPDTNMDYDLSTFVINSHMANHPYHEKYRLQELKLTERKNTTPQVNHQFLKQYIKYAREKCEPDLPNKNLDLIKQFYIKLREAALTSGGMMISVRHIQSIVRISTAHAKMHLRSQVSKEDIDVGIQCMLESFIQTQKTSVARNIRRAFQIYLHSND